MTAWWISWYQTVPLSQFELHSPWWVSGMRCSDGAETVCAAVRAEDEDAAKAIVRAAFDDDPGDIEWRFVDPLEQSPFGGRWPQAEWMAWDDERTCVCPTCEAAVAS